MFYHVVVELNSKDGRGNYEKLLEQDAVLEDIVNLIFKPYCEKQEIYIDGHFIQFANIKSLKVKKSDHKLATYTSQAQSTLSSNILFVYTDMHIAIGDKYVEDITKNFYKKYCGGTK